MQVWTISDAKSLTQMSWCPTRNGMLAVLVRNAKDIRLFDVQVWCGSVRIH